jgi:hypothetical protein
MTEQSSEINVEKQESSKTLFRSPSTIFRRIAAGLMIVLWFAILLIPVGMFWLGTGGSISIPHRSVPEPEQHPLFQINLIMDIRNRGLQFTRTSIVNIDEQNLCVQGNVDYLLWESDDTATSATYSQFYERADSEADWVFTTQTIGACER